jgi:hypothetical protein
MRQFRADVEDDIYKQIQLAKAHLDAETNAELLQMLLDEVEYEP